MAAQNPLGQKPRAVLFPRGVRQDLAALEQRENSIRCVFPISQARNKMYHSTQYRRALECEDDRL